MKTRVKICCISSVEEAKMAINAGADAIGLVSNMPSGPGIISDELIAEIAKTIPANIESFLLTSETEVEKIIIQHKKVNTTTIQLVDALSKGRYKELKEALPSIKIVQVVHVLNPASIDEALSISEQVDFLLLDSGNPNLDIKVLGGTGKTHNWNLSKIIIEQCKVPVFLAGGINANNLLHAIEIVKPYGIDLCSGLRTDKKLDKKKLKEFFRVLK